MLKWRKLSFRIRGGGKRQLTHAGCPWTSTCGYVCVLAGTDGCTSEVTMESAPGVFKLSFRAPSMRYGVVGVGKIRAQGTETLLNPSPCLKYWAAEWLFKDSVSCCPRYPPSYCVASNYFKRPILPLHSTGLWVCAALPCLRWARDWIWALGMLGKLYWLRSIDPSPVPTPTPPAQEWLEFVDLFSCSVFFRELSFSGPSM